MPLVGGVDSSTQSCKVVIRDADTGELVRYGAAPHPEGTEIDPRHWWDALEQATRTAGGTDDVAAISVGAQQHGMVCLDEHGTVVRPALLWNDTRSAAAARDLITELGEGNEHEGRRRWAHATGSVPVASFTITKLRWLATHEPQSAARVAAVALPHDWLTWRLSGSTDINDLTTDRSDASGTGYWSPTGTYRRDLLELALGRNVDDLVLPRVADPFEQVASTPHGAALGPGCGDNAAAALGLGLATGQVSVSVGTSGVVAAVSDTPTHDTSGIIAGFADATGRFLPLACTLNASRVLEATRRVLRVDYEEFDRLALAAPPGAHGLVQVPYLEGERTPDLPHATGSLYGMTLASMTPENMARAAVEGLLCHLAECLDGITRHGVPAEDIILIGGGARSHALQQIAPEIFGCAITVPHPGEYVADGAARQAAGVLAGGQLPDWTAEARHRSPGTVNQDLRQAYRSCAAQVATYAS